MCWSAEADLVAGTVVTGLGVWCLARVRRARDLPLAALPLVLGLHQLIEAAVWSGADHPASASWARTAWAVIALPVLPALVPVGVWCAAGPPALGSTAQRWRAAAALTGLTVAALLAAVLVTHPVTAEVHGHTLRYSIGIPTAAGALSAAYLLTTVGALLLGDHRLLRLLGLLMGLGAALCYALYRLAFASTWCALAALTALLLLCWAGRHEPPDPGRPRR
ncbi:DUF6629 family protein [Kitasatospora sp. NPDC002227]|uniref:DUF6629 family protein n=1 Tax=Kitasatospora sp. NPDC002227 TaxID=3154773 RepID=UPI0033178699